MSRVSKLLEEMRKINEGMWQSPFTIENAKKIEQLLSKPITFNELDSDEGKSKYWNVIGDDIFWDEVSDEAYTRPESDARFFICKSLEGWMEHPENFVKDAYSSKAAKLIQSAIEKYYKK